MSHQHNALGSPCLSHLRRQRVSPIYHGSLISLYLCFQMFILVAGAFQVQGPHEPMVAMLGGEAELSCILVPRQSTKYMKISWTRTLPSQVVHLYEDGQDKPEKAMEEYLGRTQLVKNVMHKGIMVLRILNVQPSDSGQYRCVIQHGSFYSEAVIELKVAALGSRPQFHMEVTKSRELQLECKSEGWFPQPKVQWTDSEGGEIPADSETQTQDKGGLFHVTTSLSLRETSQKNLTCSVWNPVLNQKKREQFSTAVAAPISVTEPTNTTLIILVICMALLTSITIGLYLNNRLKHQHKTSQASCPTTTMDPCTIRPTQFNNRPRNRFPAEVETPLLPKHKEAELRSWIEDLTGLSIGPDFQEGLKDGMILCTLMNKLKPGSVPKINHPMQNQNQLENDFNCMKAMASYAINSTLEPNDLSEVEMSPLALAQKAKTKGWQSGVDRRIKYVKKQERHLQYTINVASASSGSKQIAAGMSTRWA
ncbi:PREDICTED: butyrophilin subfamily 1 member A1 isoform X2 [Myotis brandtii]|nr:PREDICTED: butyrophilin subfamily 1 member A1 isoform X2 [Myotis brandtii]